MPKKVSKRWVEKGPFAPWMTAYAKWLASDPGAELTGNDREYRNRHPTSEERVARASEYSGHRVQRQLVVLLERRPDFKEYFERLRADTQFHAKELMRDQIAKNLDARVKGLDMAIAKEDHREIERYTRPILDHALPNKPDKEPVVQKFTINLFGAPPEAKQRLLAAASGQEDPDALDYEIIETEKTGEAD